VGDDAPGAHGIILSLAPQPANVDIEDARVVESVGFPLTTGLQRVYYIMVTVHCADEFAQKGKTLLILSLPAVPRAL
jgi:hypothetical protein